ncbi:MAG: PEP-CTERM sorting domain-containing protein [Verrucomicrobiota bacterium]|jgi:hypothetical protein
MKKLVLSLLVTGLAAGVYGQDLGPQGTLTPGTQGTFTFDNAGNSGVTDTVLTNGMVWIGATVPSATLLNEDINMSIADGSGLIVSLLLSDGGASGISWGGGEVVDPAFNTYYVLGTVGGGTVSVTIDAWTGSGNTYAGDLLDPSQYAGQVTFNLILGNGGSPAGPPTDFTGMPALVLLPGVSQVPEPATLALVGLGSLSLMLFRRKNS